MSKYIVEIKPEYEDSFKGLMILGAKDSNLFVDTLAVENLEELNSDYINEHFGDLQDEAYKRGFEDGKAHDNEGCSGCAYLGLMASDEPCVRCSNCYKNRYQPKKKDDEIKVGDEVADKDGDKTIVTNIHGDLFDGLCSDGSTMTDLFLCDNHKTGRHFDIESILEDMRE